MTRPGTEPAAVASMAEADLAGEGEVPGPSKQPLEKPYNPDRVRENIRGTIAIALLVLIALMTVASYAIALWGVRSIDDIGKLHALVVSPLFALTSGVVGFYFGAQSRRDQGG